MARPTKLPKYVERDFWSEVGRKVSRRTMRNAYFRHEALKILINAGLENFKFLYDPEKEGTGVKYNRKTLLTELGRIGDDNMLIEKAREICEKKSNTADTLEELRLIRGIYGSRNEVYKDHWKE